MSEVKLAKLAQEIDTLTFDFSRKERKRNLNQFVRFEFLVYFTAKLIIHEGSIFASKINMFSRVRLFGVLFIVPFAFLMFWLAFNCEKPLGMQSPVNTEAPKDNLGLVKYVFGRVTLFYELSMQRCQTATDFFTKISPKR